MVSFWKSRIDECPQCQKPIRLEETPHPPLICPECHTELVLRYKYQNPLMLICYVFAFLLACFQKLELPVFLVAFPVYGFVLFVAAHHFALSFLPLELRRKRESVQRLRLSDGDHK
jgi:hypothetical protein